MKLFIIFLFFSLSIFAEDNKVDDSLQILDDIKEPEVSENQILEDIKPAETSSSVLDEKIIHEPANEKDVQESEEVKQINSLMDEAEEEIKTSDTKEAEPKIIPTQSESSAFGADEYDGNIDSDVSKVVPYSLEAIAREDNFSGYAGTWLLNILYESAAYDGYSRQHGVELEYAWIYDLNYIAMHLLANFGYYRGPVRATGFFPLGLGAELMFGFPSWFFVSAYYGMEYAKQESSDYFTFTKTSFGIYFDLSTVSKESQFQLYRNHQIRRTYLVMKYQQRNNSDLDIYSQKTICLGLGFEY